ncbi:hypothetical protein [uncultured Leifsonia sp.]|uniref:hypothetical protein n=1 Tax=uncultured Leifsonia sp. TaxID=340359 RepID=UPI0025E4F326|nr:hypothetical protein [uncultured Leifsonia sp.]
MELIDWRRLEASVFNHLVENLPVTENTRDGLVAMVVDGRGGGGDGGVDIDVTKQTGQMVEVSKLNYFPKSFSGGHR